MTEKWFTFVAHNTQAQFGWGTEYEASQYCDVLNRKREIIIQYQYRPANDAEAMRLDIGNEGFRLDEELASRADAEQQFDELTAAIHSSKDRRMFSHDDLKLEFEGQAEWRRQKFTEQPDDQRNLDAAHIYDRLAASVDKVPADLLESYAELFEDYQDAEAASERLLSVGFSTFPDNAEQFVREFIAERTGTKI